MMLSLDSRCPRIRVKPSNSSRRFAVGLRATITPSDALSFPHTGTILLRIERRRGSSEQEATRSTEIRSDFAADLRLFREVFGGCFSRFNSTSSEDIIKEVIFLVCTTFMNCIVSLNLFSCN